MTEAMELFDKQILDEAARNYKEAVQRIEGKNSLAKKILLETLMASISLVCCITLCAGSVALAVFKHPYWALFTVLIAVYEAWWFLRKMLGCITLIVGGTSK